MTKTESVGKEVDRYEMSKDESLKPWQRWLLKFSTARGQEEMVSIPVLSLAAKLYMSVLLSEYKLGDDRRSTNGGQLEDDARNQITSFMSSWENHFRIGKMSKVGVCNEALGLYKFFIKGLMKKSENSDGWLRGAACSVFSKNVVSKLNETRKSLGQDDLPDDLINEVRRVIIFSKTRGISALDIEFEKLKLDE